MKKDAKISKKLQADASPKLVRKFSSNCKRRDKKVKAALGRAAEFWLFLDKPIQDAIYNGNFNEACAIIAKAESGASGVVASASNDTKAEKQKKARNDSAKAG